MSKIKIAQRIALVLLLMIILIGIFAEFITSNKAIVIKYKDSYYFPLWHEYSYLDFYGNLGVLVNYNDEEFVKEIRNNGFMLRAIFNNSAIVNGSYNFVSRQGFTKDHILGMDIYGRDILAIILYSLKDIIILGGFISIISLFIGFLFGLIQGYYSGIIDILMQRIYEIFVSIPLVYIILFYSSIESLNNNILASLMILFNWMFVAPYTRGATLVEKEKNYIQTLKHLGVKNIVILKHIAINIINLMHKVIPFILVGNLLTFIGLQYFGLNFGAEYGSLGELLAQYDGEDSFHIFLSAFVTIFIFIVIIFLGFSSGKNNFKS